MYLHVVPSLQFCLCYSASYSINAFSSHEFTQQDENKSHLLANRLTGSCSQEDIGAAKKELSKKI